MALPKTFGRVESPFAQRKRDSIARRNKDLLRQMAQAKAKLADKLRQAEQTAQKAREAIADKTALAEQNKKQAAQIVFMQRRLGMAHSELSLLQARLEALPTRIANDNTGVAASRVVAQHIGQIQEIKSRLRTLLGNEKS